MRTLYYKVPLPPASDDVRYKIRLYTVLELPECAQYFRIPKASGENSFDVDFPKELDVNNYTDLKNWLESISKFYYDKKGYLRSLFCTYNGRICFAYQRIKIRIHTDGTQTSNFAGDKIMIAFRIGI